MSQSSTQSEAFIHSAECYEVKYFDGRVATRDGEVVWLGVRDGRYTCESSKGSAKGFNSPLTTAEAARWDGMPWHRRLKPGTLRCFRVTTTTTVVHEEVEVIQGEAQQYDAKLRRVGVMWPKPLRLSGEIYEDRKGRFTDGLEVTTSVVQSIDGNVVRTRNSVYLVEWLSDEVRDEAMRALAGS